MRILHTADWHLGKTIEGRPRRDEQEGFIDEICVIADRENVDIVLIAGDVFQSPNPSNEAHKLFFDALDRLADQGRRGVVVIAGNHDSPDRLSAPSLWADKLGITLIGYPYAELPDTASLSSDRIRRVACGPSWLELAVPGQDHNAVIVALPYPSEGRLKEILGALDEQEQLQGYNEKLSEILNRLRRQYREDTVNLLMSHLYVRNGIISDNESEVDIQMGGAYAVDPKVLDIGAQYVALGHLHKPQSVSGCGAPARYAGSPLPYGFAETGNAKSVVVVDAKPGENVIIREIMLSTPHPLVLWEARGGLEEVHRWIDEGRHLEAWINLEVYGEEMINGLEIQKLRERRPRILNIWSKSISQGEEQQKQERLAELPLAELFCRFHARQTNGLKPDEALTNLFLKLVVEMDEEEGGDVHEAS